MAVETNPFAIQSLTYFAEIVRRAIASLLKRGATIGSVTGGIVATGDMAVTAGPSMHVKVAAGEAWIAGSTSATQSGYYARVSSASELAIAAADGTNPRVDRVVAVVKDAAYAGAESSFSLAVVTGTPTAAATLANRETHGYPAAPASSLTLAAVLVPAKVSSIVSEDVEVVAPLLDLGLTLGAGVVGTTQLAALAVTAAKIAEATITSTKLGTGAALGNLAAHTLTQGLQSPGTPASGQVYGGAGQTAENTHKAITGLSIETPSIVSGQVLVVWFSPSIEAHENVVSAVLTLGGAEVGTVVNVSGSPDAYASPTTVRRFTGLTGVQTLAGVVWGSSSAGGTQENGSSIYYEVRNS
jgi:hypothetical protein